MFCLFILNVAFIYECNFIFSAVSLFIPFSLYCFLPPYLIWLYLSFNAILLLTHQFSPHLFPLPLHFPSLTSPLPLFLTLTHHVSPQLSFNPFHFPFSSPLTSQTLPPSCLPSVHFPFTHLFPSLYPNLHYCFSNLTTSLSYFPLSTLQIFLAYLYFSSLTLLSSYISLFLLL